MSSMTSHLLEADGIPGGATPVALFTWLGWTLVTGQSIYGMRFPPDHRFDAVHYQLLFFHPRLEQHGEVFSYDQQPT